MAETVNWSIAVQVPTGPRVAQSGALQVDAYDKLEVSIDDGAEDLEVQLQPGGAGQVRLLVIATTQASADLSYKVNDAGGDAITLDQPVHAYFGTGPVSLLDAGSGPNTLFFTNESGGPAVVQVLVGRKAIP